MKIIIIIMIQLKEILLNKIKHRMTISIIILNQIILIKLSMTIPQISNMFCKQQIFRLIMIIYQKGNQLVSIL
mgnify:CR=1 FL=1